MDMDPNYIRSLQQAYVHFFHRYRAVPVLTIDTSSLDFRSNPEAVTEVIRALETGLIPPMFSTQLEESRRMAGPLSLPGFA